MPRQSFKGWVWDRDLGDFVYTVVPGETWVWRWLDARTGEVLAYHSLRFEGGEDLCWDNGWCGGFEGWWAAAPLQCMAEDQRIRVEIYHNGLLLGADSFRPTRFVPSLDASLAESIEPRRTRSGSGEATDVSVRVTDDLGCGQPLGGAVVRIASTVMGGTNGQLYLVQGDRGTGRFSSLGYNAVLNPDTPNTHDTVIEGETDVQGVFKARYQAQDHGAEEILSFDVKRPAGPSDPEVIVGETLERPLSIAIPDLAQITAENGAIGFADKGGCPHEPKPHWLTPRTRSKVLALAAVYNVKTGRMLSLNDASLPLGGVIANSGGNGRDASCHDSHRQGIDIDINREDTGGKDLSVETVAQRGVEDITLLEYMDVMVVEGFQGTLHHTYKSGVLRSIHWRLP